MSPLLSTYKIEYETTSITIPELCAKYNVSTKDLKGYTKWTKPLTIDKEDNLMPEQPIEIVIAPRVPTNTSKLIVESAPKIQPANIEPSDDITKDIEAFKKQAMAHALKFMSDDAEFAEVKEFKDMVAIVDSIEKSYKGTETTSTPVTMLVQNIVNNFKDDC